MRIKHLWVDRFKNLHDFDIDFGDHLTTVILGGNATGKSNLLEALAIIFRDLDLRNRDIPFEYYLLYECRDRLIEIDANPSQTRPVEEEQLTLFEGATSRKRRPGYLNISIDGKPTTITAFYEDKASYLPKHVFGYYSGPTNRLAQHFDQHQKKFYDEQRKGEDSPLRPLFFALPVHSQFVLLAYFSFQDDEDTKFLKDCLGITGLESVLFVLKEPDWAHDKKHPEHLFWGATGVPADFMHDLYDVALAPHHEEVPVPVGVGKGPREQRLYLYIKDKSTLQKVAQKRGSNQEFFKALDTLYIARLIAEVRIRVKQAGVDGDVTFTELSEGEQQLLTVMGLLKFTHDTESLFLLDEPDTHLNPAWKLEYMNLIEPIVNPGGDEDDSKCQILLATHDPIVIGSCVKEQVRVLAFKDGDRSKRIICFQPDEDPRGMGVAALLTSEIYGLRSSLDWETQQKLDQKRQLAAKEPDELTDTEMEKLQRLNEELRSLGFNYEFRDPLYGEFLEAWAEEVEAYPELQKAILTKEEKALQAELARQIATKLKSRTRDGQAS